MLWANIQELASKRPSVWAISLHLRQTVQLVSHRRDSTARYPELMMLSALIIVFDSYAAARLRDATVA